ncbi:Transcription-repair-coupling factor [Glycine soja]|uniref:Transcription-repair-coupling factor n=1 Tax=Glycine soja TaxID=3848 RepID=A0A0B2SNG9_GLYSO|nr:Transcription-repair-coupling factor [Glycine soja]
MASSSSLLPRSHIPTPLISKLTSSPRTWSLFILKYPSHPKTNSNNNKRLILPPTNAVYTQSPHTPSTPSKTELHNDAITVLNERIRRDFSKKEAFRTVMDSEEAGKYMQMVKVQQQRGLQKLKGDRGTKDGVFSYKVDPYTLRSGDYVVHRKVGVGRFVGMRFDVAKNSSQHTEYVFIEYADGMAKLPVHQAAKMLYRYSLPNETKKPKALSKLSDTSAWERRKVKGKVAIQKMVVDLMELYLHRLKQRRPPYPKSPAMAKFAAQFPYEPTPDQKRAFIDVERDLTERETPMDRLICGDVGFGKTEVALRAISCVVSAKKQAMVLAPTIVLAKQHFDVISERFSVYPDIKVGLLSRFQTKAEKEENLDKIKNGTLDIIVGTHSLLGDRVTYNNLGLLVVDEEQLRGRVGRADKEAHAYLFYPDKGLLSDQALERLAAIEECRELGQGFQLAEKDMGIRGFGAIFGEQQSGDVGNVGIDLFFEMLFESLSKVEDHHVVSVPYHSVQVDININPHLPSDYINYLDNPMKIINDAERVAEKDIWSLMQFTENLRHQYGKEPRSMEILLKKLYLRRMAADLGITSIYSSGKMIYMKTNMSKKVFKMMTESMASDLHRNSLVLEGDQIKAELLLELPKEQLLNWIFQCLAELHASLPSFIKY